MDNAQTTRVSGDHTPLGSVAALTPPPAPPVIVNGDFESGLAGWTRADQLGSEGTFFVQTGTLSPVNGTPVPAPPQGTSAAMTDAGGPGSHVLYQDFVASGPSGTLSFALFLGNRADRYATPNTLDFATPALNQQARVDILRAGADPFSLAAADILLTLFRTQAGDPLVNGYFTVTSDIGMLLAAHTGEVLRLRFAVTDNIAPFQVGVDNVRIVAADCTPPTFLNDQTIVLDASKCGNDGNISITPLTGTAPFMYSINGGATYVTGPNSGRTFQNLTAGTYMLRLKDANGCESAIVTRVVKPDVYECPPCTPPTFLNNNTIVLDASCKGGDGNISIIPTSGVGPFMYSINGGATYVAGPNSGFTFQNLSAGTYQLRLKAGNGCESAVVTKVVKANAFGPCVVMVSNPKLRSVATDIAASVRTYPNPSHGQFQMQLQGLNSQRVQVQILDSRGSVVQARSLNAQEGSTLDVNLQGKAKGLYFVRVISDKGTQVSKVLIQ